jgi:type IV pilus assembly protein PilO
LAIKTGLEGKPWWHGLIAGVLAGAVFFGLMYLWQLKPKREQIAALEADLKAKQQQILKGRAAQQQLPEFRRQVQELQLQLDKLLRILPVRRKTADLLRRLRSLAEQGDLTLKRFTPGQLADKDFYSEWPIEVAVEGVYHNLALFFDKISHYSRIINIENLNIEAFSGKGPHTIRASFIAKTFVYKPPPAPAPDETGTGAAGTSPAVAGAGGTAAAPGTGSPLTQPPPGGAP